MIEDYGRFLKKKERNILSEERSRSGSRSQHRCLDGIDLRETVRNWHEGKIYVKSQEKVHGEVGSVIVIFDEDPAGRYGYADDVARRASKRERLGGIFFVPVRAVGRSGDWSRSTGGFLMSLPARRMYDVWQDPDYDMAESKSERLLLAGLVTPVRDSSCTWQRSRPGPSFEAWQPGSDGPLCTSPSASYRRWR